MVNISQSKGRSQRSETMDGYKRRRGSAQQVNASVSQYCNTATYQHELTFVLPEVKSKPHLRFNV